MKTAADILASKSDRAVHTIAASTSVFDAVRRMAEKSVGALVVVENDRVVGIVSERDYARKIVLMARSSKDTPVRDIMSSPVLFVRPEQTSEDCMALMTENRLHRLPIMHSDRLVGLISIGDLVKDIIRAAIRHRTARTLHLRAAPLIGPNASCRYAA